MKVVIPLGVKDTVTAKYMRQNNVFADAFNYFVYNGRQVIDPDSLEELDTREIEVPYGGEEGAEQPVQRTRDVIKSVTAMTDKKAAYLVLAVENQSNVNYAMAVRNMVYDALQYAKQVEKAVASHKKSGDYKAADNDEFLSGFMKSDHLLPVATLVIYFGPKPWDGPMSIHEMFQSSDAEMLSIIPDYRINLIAPAAMDDSDFDKFSSTLREVLSFIKYSGNGDELEKVVNSNQEFRHLGRTEVDVLNACVNANLTMKQDEEVLDVCQAIQTIADRAEEKGRIEALLLTIKNLMQNTGWSADQTMENMKVSDADRKALAPFL
ncbi:MAG: Rpn family recombination-promoting nuclease/putative transposase [Lachnospiraceae bacterium]|nr:Rpn family recombination-promoting nuclease/putative transposase [Lachnospiraceae bacterium]